MHWLVAAVVGIPFLGAVACIAARDRASKIVAVAATLITAATAVAIAAKMPEKTFLFGKMPWLGTVNDSGFFGYELNSLAIVMLLVSTVIGVAIIVYSMGYLSEGNREHATRTGHARYYFWLMLFVGSMAGIAISPTLLQLLIFWEMTTLCSWALISFYDDEESLRAGMKALMMTSFGGLFLIGGTVWVLIATGSLDFSALGKLSYGDRAWAFALFLIAAWAKSAQVPFYTWLPDAMTAPTPISAYLHAAAMVKAGVFLIAKLLLAGWAVSTGVALLVGIAALVTMFVALYLYFLQDDLKRLLAYSTIAQLGLIMLGIALGSLGSELAARGAVLHLMMHACAKTLLFLSVGAISYAYGTRKISKLSGLAQTLPIAAVAFFVGTFALAGVPPLACFWSKFYILSGALQLRSVFGPISLILILVESLVSFGWFLWVGQQVFFGKPKRLAVASTAMEHSEVEKHETAAGAVVDPPRSIEWILIGLVVVALLVPVVGIPIVQKIVVP